jgi:hypothetical protein
MLGRRCAAELDRLCDRIIASLVVVECRHPGAHQGKLFEIGIDLVLPGHRIAVHRDPGLDHAHEDAHVTVRDAFDSARRQLEDYLREQRDAAKARAASVAHPAQP